METRLEDYMAKQEIRDVLVHRARAADRFDPDLMKAFHAPGGTGHHGPFSGDARTFIDLIVAMQKTGHKCFTKLHVVNNMLIEVNGDEAFAESYHIAHEKYELDDGPTDYKIAGRYLDTFKKIDERWMISHRDVIYDWSRVSASTQNFWDFVGHKEHLQGSRDMDDPLYRAFPAAREKMPQQLSLNEKTRSNGNNAMTKLENDIQQLLDRQEISEVLYSRARAADRADPKLAHRCYHSGATERHGDFDGLAKDFIDDSSSPGSGKGDNASVKSMFDFVSNITMDFLGPDEAFVESYHVTLAAMNTEDGVVDATVAGRYLDRFTRQDGRWAISHRDVVFDWSRVEPEVQKFWDKFKGAAFLLGSRDSSDHLYKYTKRGA